MKIKITTILFFCLMAFGVQAKSLKVSDAWIKAVPPKAMMSAAYMTIHNSSKKDVKLVKAESPLSHMVELHTHMKDGDVMKMRQVPFIKVPANGKAILKPMSFHVMFMHLHEKVSVGKSFPLTLHFDNGEKITIKAKVQKLK